MNCPTCHAQARHVAGQVHWCEPCNRNLLDRGNHADVMQCDACAAWLPNGARPHRGLCTEAKSRKDETEAADTCAFWEPVNGR